MKILIAGHSSYTGLELIKFLRNKNLDDLFGADLKLSYQINEQVVDFTKFDEIYNLIKTQKPDLVFFLIGANNCNIIQDYFNINNFTLINLLESIIQNKLFDTKVLSVSSSAVYGVREKPIANEIDLPNPINWYGVSKLAMEYSAFMYYYLHKIKINIVRTFNIFGKNQPLNFFIPDIINKLNNFNINNLNPVLETGNLSLKRDFINIMDVLEAYWVIINADNFGQIYNVGSSKSRSLREVADLLIEKLNLKIQIIEKKDKFPGIFIPDLISDNSKINKLGWLPKLIFEDSLDTILEKTT